MNDVARHLCTMSRDITGGVAARVETVATAFGGDRSAAFTYNVRAIWDDPTDDQTNLSWARSFAAALDQFGNGTPYLNFRSEPPMRPPS
ncbi:MAG: hypothetical protein LC721_06100 [Actinobacteria bacterium]|nr:hypothetical protein [Actinomycetota bacterium]